ncbi:glycerophosphodiester phosphodiesterase family protein [Leucobacter chromiiresistens]|uniref:Glycerophosphodiester phosphodiesterase n=1 Tax=Leucobacter chromiiresistens TaxID=1079994 RepID=A0A147ER60_9MICO|nr:glycerophosphodiester phosphodiesterase family protein [Leucobacter chromiiresistens]KTR86978.1 glycerophosphodiester phosphodiesterase [Leucobacter chromiiresistens]
MTPHPRDPHPYLADASRPRVIAHRGFVSDELAQRGVAENTRAAFTAALAAGADILETDCHLTRDGAVVLAHDADLSRVTGDPREIGAVDRVELARIFAERGGLLTLEEALAEYPRARWNIDVKSRAVAAPLGRIVARHGARVLVTSFSDSLRRTAFAAAAGERPAILPATSPGRGALVRVLLASATGSRRAVRRALAGLDALQIPERQGRIRVLTPRLVAAAHANGVEVHVWTVNDADRMRELTAMGVDGVVTDRTDLALATLRP